MEQMITVTMTVAEFRSFLRKEIEAIFDEKIEPLKKRFTEEHLTVNEVAEALKVTSRTVYNMVDRGDLISYGKGRRLRFRESDITQYLNPEHPTSYNTL